MKMQPALTATYNKIGINPEKEYLEIAPTCHFFMGGVKVNENWHSTLPGLFAAGETAVGVHGANRLSQNALAELLVTGARAGKGAAQFAANTSRARVNPSESLYVKELVDKLYSKETGVRPSHLRKQLRTLMWEKVGVYRTADELNQAAAELQGLAAQLDNQYLPQQSKHYNMELLQGLENRFLINIAQVVAAAALNRTESRGAHFRNDYPQTDNHNWLEHIVITAAGQGIKMDKVPVDLREVRPAEVGGQNANRQSQNTTV
jgi:succinate dehydrogenase/fumarate reductase flavoprotein subunit